MRHSHSHTTTRLQNNHASSPFVRLLQNVLRGSDCSGKMASSRVRKGKKTSATSIELVSGASCTRAHPFSTSHYHVNAYARSFTSDVVKAFERMPQVVETVSRITGRLRVAAHSKLFHSACSTSEAWEELLTACARIRDSPSDA